MNNRPTYLSDPALPHLVTALDVDAMQRILQSDWLMQTAPLGSQIERCTIERLKYKPGRNCLVSYRLQIRKTLTKTEQEQLITARFYPPCEAAAHYAKASTQLFTTPAFGAPITYIPHLAAVLWGFPNDRKLAGLPVLVNPHLLEEKILPPLIAANFGPQWRIVELRTDLVHYAPEYTCTVRVPLVLEEKQTRNIQMLTFYGKTYENPMGGQTDHFMQQLWESTAGRQGYLQVARPLGYDPVHKLLWQVGLPGEALLTIWARDAINDQPFRAAGRAVAALHQSPIRGLSTLTMNDWLVKLRQLEALLAQVRPTIQVQAQAVISRLTAQAEHLAEQPQVTLHGDLHLKNILLHAEQAALIDLDNLATGVPGLDLGSLIAGMLHRCLVEGIPCSEAWHLAQQFISAYAGEAPWRISQPDLNWYIATALLAERALRSVARLKTGNFAIIDQVIALAGEISGQ